MPKGHPALQWNQGNNERLFLSILAVHTFKIDKARVASLFGGAVTAAVIERHMGNLRSKAKKLFPGVVPTNIVMSSAPTTTTHTTVDTKKRASTANGSSKGSKRVKVEPNGDEDEEADNLTVEGTSDNDDGTPPPRTPIGKMASANGANKRKSTDNGADFAAPMTPTSGKKTNKTSTPTSSAATPGSSGRTPRASPRKIPTVSYAELDDPFEKMEREGLFDGEEIVGGESSITLGEEIFEDNYDSDGTQDEYKNEDAGDAATDDMEMEV
ncbi:MAG: hypothetical protein M1836_003045 [Candelina mexicana]|nr:MAG: hypothetical protein M1836_003045 [Candelina mexicana]